MKWLKQSILVLLVAVVALSAYALVSEFRASALTSTASTDNTTTALTSQLRSEDPLVRANAAVALTGTTDRAGVAALLSTLADSDPTVGHAAALALSQSEDPIVADSLVAELANEAPEVRQRAALSLSRMASVPVEAVPALMGALNDPAAAQAAAQALVRIGSPEAQAALLSALSDDALTTRRHAAMAALEQSDPALAQAVLGRALASDNMILVRNATALRDFIATAN